MDEDRELSYSMIFPIVLDKSSREKQAKKILSIVEDFKGKSLRDYTCLDIGCSGGHISAFLANHFQRVIGIDIDRPAIEFAREHYRGSNIEFCLGDAMALPFPHNYFDVVICNQVYNCVPNAEALMKEIHRVLKRRGICFLGARNALGITEPKNRLIQWFAERWPQHRFAKLTKRKDLRADNLLSYWQLKSLCRHFSIYDYTLKVIREPQRFKFPELIKYRPLINLLPLRILEKLIPFMPTYLWILEKAGNGELSGAICQQKGDDHGRAGVHRQQLGPSASRPGSKGRSG